MRPTVLPALFLLLSSLHGHAQTNGSYSLDFELSKKDFADSITIEYKNNRVYVPVKIGGQTYRFLFDTGASHAVVYDDMLFRGCKPNGTIVSNDAVGKKDTVQILSMPPVTIGSLTLTGCQATLQHRPVRRPGVDGILGFDLVCKGLFLKIDTRQNLMVITDRKKHFAAENGHKMKYKMNYHVPYLTVTPFKGYQEQALFDTGSRRLYSMNKASFDKGEKACIAQNAQQIEGRAVGRHAIGMTGAEPLGEVVFLCLDDLCLGGYSFGDLHTLTTQGGSHVGARLLEYGSVVMNPKTKCILFQPYNHSTRSLVGNKQLEKAIVNEKGQPVVGLVWEKSEAYKAGLRQGDVILKADEHPIRSFADYLAFRPLIGQVYTITVRDRRGFLKEVKMKW
jgi:hypothetical protein